jgi:hypothetical protein
MIVYVLVPSALSGTSLSTRLRHSNIFKPSVTKFINNNSTSNHNNSTSNGGLSFLEWNEGVLKKPYNVVQSHKLIVALS